MIRTALCSLALATALPVAGSAQPSNHIAQVAAEIMIANGCAMNEADLLRGMQANGLGGSDFQAQVMALHRGGYLVSGGESVLRLVKWSPCK